MAALAMMISRTAPRNGGIVISKELFLGMIAAPPHRLILTASALSFRRRHNGKALVAPGVYCPDCKDDIVLGKFHRNAHSASSLLDMLPFRAARGSPQH